MKVCCSSTKVHMDLGSFDRTPWEKSTSDGESCFQVSMSLQSFSCTHPSESPIPTGAWWRSNQISDERLLFRVWVDLQFLKIVIQLSHEGLWSLQGRNPMVNRMIAFILVDVRWSFGGSWRINVLVIYYSSLTIWVPDSCHESAGLISQLVPIICDKSALNWFAKALKFVIACVFLLSSSRHIDEVIGWAVLN